MFCKFCGEKLEDSALFCTKCGNKVNAQDIEETVEVEESSNSMGESSKKLNPIIQKIVDTVKPYASKILFFGGIAGIAGVSIFLLIVLIGLIAYGDVYLFDGYAFTKVVTVISMVLMMVGLLSIVSKILLNIFFKFAELPKTLVKRVLMIALAVSCLGFSLWGFVNCANEAAGGLSGSFAKVYKQCDCSLPWAVCGEDYLTIDTNPFDYNSSSSSSKTYSSVALWAIEEINSKLVIPSYVYDDMMETSSLDGRCSYSGADVEVSWRYHPNTGLEVRYTKK